MKNKLVGFCLLIAMIFSCCITVNALDFADTEGHWAEEYIAEWSNNGILNGIGNNKFNPDGYMTRAEAAAVFSRLLALSERANISDFKDVDSDAWYAESLEKCVAAGILNGDGNNMNPGGYITREMFFTMFGRAFSIQPESTLSKEFSDADEISSWAQGYTYAFINQGYVNGVTKDTVAPKQNIDRASVITLLDRLIANYAVQDNGVIQSTDKGISLVIANNCTVVDGFSGTVVISGGDTKISFKGTSVNTKIIVKADNVIIADVPEGVTVSIAKGAEKVEVNGKQVEDNTIFAATVEKVEEKKPTVVGGGGHSHRYIGNETTKATCTEDGVMTYTCRCGRSYTEAIPKLSENDEHTPAEPVKENETETTYDEVVYCSVCTVEISRTQKSNVSCTEHIPGTPVKENEVAGNCQTTATYDEVVYCSVCGTHEISRTQKTGELGDHVPSTPVKENEVAGTCLVAGTYDEVVYCSVCGTHEISRTQKTGELGDHTSGTPVRENEVTGNCQTPATYDEVVYCSVCGTHEISRTSKTGELGEHTPGTPVKENEVVGDCQTPATYDEVVYCSVCGTYEISRTQKTGELGEHTPGTPVKENEVAGNCQTPATYDEVVYCSVCGTHEISRTQKTGELGDHTPGTPVKENEVAGNCQTTATYDEVVYCSICGTHEISRISKTGELGDHTLGTPVKENEVAGNCQTTATYDEVIYCSVCGTHEISRTQKTGALGNHTPGTPVKENEVAGDCQTPATYDEVVYCSVCGTHEISRTQKTGELGNHTPGTPVKENEVTGNCQTPATYDEVVYCSVCGTHEISRTQKTGALGDHTPGTPVRENEVAGNCQTHATYDEVVYCSVCGTHEISRTQKTGELGNHIPATAVRENEVDGNCQTPATYDEVVYCSVCGTHEISRTQKTGGLGNHTPGTPVKENEVVGNCQVPATYDEVVYCSVCGTHEISRIQKTSGYGEHTPSTPVIENEVAGTCTVEGTYEEVVYCSVCGTHEISRTHKTSGYSEHIPNTPVKENEVTGTCKVEGTYDEVVYCSVCNTHEISRTQKTTGYGDHKFTGGNCEYCGEAETQDTPEFIVDSVTASAGDTIEIAVSVKNNPGIFDMILSFTYDSTAMTLTKTTNGDVLSDATFMAPKNMASGCRATWYYMDEPVEYADGSVVTLTFDILDTATAGDYTVTVSYSEGDINNYDGDPLSFKITSGTVKIGGSSHAHTPDNAVKENEVLGTCIVKTTYDEVVYCSECGDEISRTQKTGDYGTHKYVSGNCEYCGEAEESDEPQFNVSSITASAGDSVQVVVSLKNNPAIFDMILSFTYDSNAMTLKSVTNGEVMSDATFMAPKNMASGCRATWYYMDEPAEYIDGSVVTLTFDILNTAVAGEYGVSVSYNDGDINNYDGDPLSFAITYGVITVE